MQGCQTELLSTKVVKDLLVDRWNSQWEPQSLLVALLSLSDEGPKHIFSKATAEQATAAGLCRDSRERLPTEGRVTR